MAKPLVHLIAGSTGAGKTTFAMALAERIGGVRFSIDEWMAALFWMDSPQPLQAEWSLERVRRCTGMIWQVAAQSAARGVPVVLDLGFTTRASRADIAARAAAAGLSAQLHLCDVPAEERWRRVAARNAGDGATRQLDFAVTREMFDFVESLWEPPTREEMREIGAKPI